jgi:hypothetical protein
VQTGSSSISGFIFCKEVNANEKYNFTLPDPMDYFQDKGMLKRPSILHECLQIWNLTLEFEMHEK